MKLPVVFMFPGQGSQYFQMARELYDEHPRFRLWMHHCSEVTRPLIDASLVEIIYRGKKSEDFDRILHSNPALLAVEFSLAKIVMEAGIKPDYLLGYSLGEFTAAVISGALTIEQALTLVVDYAKILEAKSPVAGMLAVLGNENLLTQHSDLFKGCWLTGRNFENNFVVSGLLSDIQRAQQGLVDKAIPCQKLPVNYGFHTKLIESMEQDFKFTTEQYNLHALTIPTISSMEAREITSIESDHFWRLVRRPIQFSQTVRRMVKKNDYVFVDIGPSGSLATAVKYNLPDRSSSRSIEVMNQFGRDLKTFGKFLQSLENEEFV